MNSSVLMPGGDGANSGFREVQLKPVSKTRNGRKRNLNILPVIHNVQFRANMSHSNTTQV